MATDLFSKYYDNPHKQSIYTNMTCAAALSADELQFSISGNNATISNGAVTLATLNLSNIIEHVTQWRNEARVIEPYSYIYVKGIEEGLSYQKYEFGPIPYEIQNADAYLYTTNVDFYIKYYKNGTAKLSHIEGIGDYDDKISYIDNVQEKINALEIPITFTVENDNLCFTSTVLGYEFYIRSDVKINSVRLYTNEASIIDPSVNIILNEDENKYVPFKKYRNGAFRGVLLVPIYPKYNAQSVELFQKSLRIAHIKNRIESYNPIDASGNTYERKLKDVIDCYCEIAEIEKFNNWRYVENGILENNEIIGNDSISMNIIDASTGLNNMTGLYGFINWVHEHNMFTNVGKFYSVITPPDPVDDSWKNLVGGFLIYNPNPFPIQVGYMVFS